MSAPLASSRSRSGTPSCSHCPLVRDFAGLRLAGPRPAAAFVRIGRQCSGRVSVPAIEARAKAAGMGLWGTKAGMTQIYTEEGPAYAATVIALEGGNVVTQIKSDATDGYAAVQVGYQTCKEGKITKPQLGHLKKFGADPMRKLREFRIPDTAGFEPGQQLKLEDIFKEGDAVDVAGTTIGKGFQGTIKRWHHARGQMTHGSKSKRQHGSIGSSATPSRVLPGLRMAGQMGNKRRTVRNLEILKVFPDKGALIVKGAVPGKVGNVLELTPHKIVGTNC